MRGRQSTAMLTLLGVEELIAKSTEEYLAIARKLAVDASYRQEISQTILAHRNRLFDDPAPPREFARILEHLVRDPLPPDAAGKPANEHGQ